MELHPGRDSVEPTPSLSQRMCWKHSNPPFLGFFSQGKPQNTAHWSSASLRHTQEKMQRSQENSSLFAWTISIHPNQFPAALLSSSRMWKTCDPMAYPSPKAFPKKGGIPDSLRSSLHLRASVLNPRAASTQDREFLNSHRGSKSQMLFLGETSPSRRKPKAGSGRSHPRLCLETTARNSQRRGEIQNQRESTPNQVPNSMYRSSPRLGAPGSQSRGVQGSEIFSWESSTALSQPHIQGHHHHKAQDGGPRCQQIGRAHV